MDRKPALFLALAITLLIVTNYLFFTGNLFENQREKVVLSRAIDGDTVELKDGRIIRLVNVNTPERGEFGYDRAKEFLEKFVGETIELEVVGIGKYGRTLGRIYTENYINLELVKKGLAHSYLVEKGELKEFKRVENEARLKGLGIWEKSEHNGCLDVEINKKEEFLVIEDACDLNFKGWMLKDESTKRYKFGNIQKNQVTLYSGKGQDNENEIFWGRNNVWNNDKDSIFIRDEKGLLVYYDSYGY